MCLPDNLRLNVVLDSILYYGMLCTLPIWLYPIVRVIKKTFNYNEILGVLAIILISWDCVCGWIYRSAFVHY